MKRLLTIIAATACLCSCKEMRQQLAEMMRVDSAVKSQFNCEDVNINITNGNSVNVSIINSRFNDSSDAVKQAIADSVGVICPRYMRSSHIKQGMVLFVVQHKEGIVTTSNSAGFPMHIKQP